MKQLSQMLRVLAFGGVMLLAGLLAGGTFQVGTAGSPADTQSNIAQPLVLSSDLMTEMERVFAEIYNRVAPSVVAITVTTEGNTSTFGGGFSTGSGFVVDMQGHIITNLHVVDDAETIEVVMFDGTQTRATFIGGDADSDLAVIKVDIPAERLRPVPLADSDTVRVGQTVLAIGNPFANDWTLTSGIVSALNRRISGLNNYSIGGVIQTDAAINPGNSGGPLLNLQGEVIGVNSQINSQTRSNSGVGFAVPSNLVKRVSQELIAQGFVRYSYIGIHMRDIDLDLIERLNLPDNIRGVAVRQAVSGFPAAVSGIQSMGVDTIDVITAIDGLPMRNFDELIGYLAINTEPGQTVNLTVYRNGEILNVPVTLAERP